MGVNDRYGPVGTRAGEVGRRRRAHGVKAEQQVCRAVAHTVRFLDGVVADREVRDDGPALLSQPCLIERRGVFAIEQGGRREQSVDRDNASATNARHQDVIGPGRYSLLGGLF